MSAFLIFHGRNSIFINSLDKTFKFYQIKKLKIKIKIKN